MGNNNCITIVIKNMAKMQRVPVTGSQNPHFDFKVLPYFGFEAGKQENELVHIYFYQWKWKVITLNE